MKSWLVLSIILSTRTFYLVVRTLFKKKS